ncbi:hypothetical protein LshimejAT787_0103260 [Lyophyllum shimeji]|uniref:Uncharacterized protein n=1 Tax=Lyophyllum shimeji TaxID=47721 RepID=A0A9P3PCS1_LYOSH|nr:hypothetical protein LshimejAT787_0103260 [Lyophyllum shimeji]
MYLIVPPYASCKNIQTGSPIDSEGYSCLCECLALSMGIDGSGNAGAELVSRKRSYLSFASPPDAVAARAACSHRVIRMSIVTRSAFLCIL